MNNNEWPITPDKETSKKRESGRRERYSGVCDVYSPEEAHAMADELRRNRKNPDRKVMIGVMTHPLVLNPEMADPNEVREVFPAREAMAGGFTDDSDVLNTVHYADLYGPNGGQNIFENLELVVRYGGEYLHAIQLDLVWPEPAEIKKFKEKNPNIIIILQVGKFAIEDTKGDPQEIVNRLHEYGDSVGHVLLDMSMGKGESMEAGGLLPLLRLIKKKLPELGLAVAGGLGPESSPGFNLIAREFPDISHDAQGNVKPADAPRDRLGHLISTTPADSGRSIKYIQEKCAILDNPLEE
jgi:hypothetical protein